MDPKCIHDATALKIKTTLYRVHGGKQKVLCMEEKTRITKDLKTKTYGGRFYCGVSDKQNLALLWEHGGLVNGEKHM